jgi:hypothetical protein
MSAWGASPDEPVDAFAAWAVAEIGNAAAVGADEVRFELNLTGVPIDRQVAALVALAASLDLPSTADPRR